MSDPTIREAIDTELAKSLPDPGTRAHRKAEVLREFAATINRHNLESGSNTPDFILAELLWATMETYHRTTNKREEWWGSVGETPPEEPCSDPEID